MRILFVCTANVCRSPAAEQLLVAALAQRRVPADIQVSSAGILASGRSAICPYTAALIISGGTSAVPVPIPVESPLARHRSRPLDREQVDRADLVLAADTRHRGAVLSLAPAARSRTFLVVQAGRLAQWLLEAGMVQAGFERAAFDEAARAQAVRAQAGGGPGAGQEAGAGWALGFAEGDPRISVPPVPPAGQLRAQWLVAELGEARGMAPRAVAPARRSRHRGEQELLDDLPDPHEVGMGVHPEVFARINAATQSLADLLTAVLGGPPRVPDKSGGPAE